MNIKPLFLVAIMLLALSGASAAQVYKWVDEDGGVHYGERPPADTSAQSIDPGNTQASPEALKRLENQQRRAEQLRLQREEAEAREAARREEARLRRENCAIARENLVKMETSIRVYDRTEDGTRYRVPYEEREEKMAKAREQIDTWCD